MTSPDVIVVGAGVLGLFTAAELAARGRSVTVVDPGGPNASSIAAGMIAPAIEALIDGLSSERAALLARARDLWPAAAERLDIALDRSGTDWRADGPDADQDRLSALGFDARPQHGGLYVLGDWRVDAAAAMHRLVAAPGVGHVAARVLGIEAAPGALTVTLSDGRRLTAPDLVLATGVERALPGIPARVARRLSAIQPIRGQITAIRGQPPARTLRTRTVYVAPAPGGALVGATMQPGRRALTVDAAALECQMAEALRLVDGPFEIGPTRVGVRGATPDGLPLAGPTETPGLHLALAPRRNGWLLGPLVGRTVADGVEGRAPGSDAVALDPLRFG